MNYNKYPVTKIETETEQAWRGYKPIVERLRRAILNKSKNGKCVLAFETYPGVDEGELLSELISGLKPKLLLDTKETLCKKDEFQRRIHTFLTDDRVFARMYYGEFADFQQEKLVLSVQKRIEDETGLIIVYGMGSSEIYPCDILVYADMARWEIQQRYRRGMPNYYTDNANEDNLKKIKQGYFFEWRIADKIKRRSYDKIDFYLDTNRQNDPSMITGEVFRNALLKVSDGPFRTVPYFDPGVWGGQWMKTVCGLDRTQKNFAWSFDGVPEENSIYLDVNGVRVESPAINVVFYCPKKLLGERVFARFGAEFPIRFDFLDTMGGQNLSLQVHPLTDYIHNQFGMNYTQDESYYILDAEEDACVYLGLKDNANPKEMFDDLRSAQEGKILFDAEKYVNCFPAKKHDHFLIPAGTIHCSGRNCMVLEISATPYLFTMKLWDWGRLGLDGRPRPIHIDHGEKVVQWDRRTEWVKNNLINRVCLLKKTEEYTEEHTGLHELEFIETRRYTIHDKCNISTDNNLNMLNLVEGESVWVESPTGAFAPYEVHYAETFIIPACVQEYTIRSNSDKPVKVIRAYVR
ncbi:MAG: class I mannose-6-phosphate isomerase [Clostridiales bacterium]|nr:class I mannose-6-phosphate isomerase [Clostridiales bacterium]